MDTSYPFLASVSRLTVAVVFVYLATLGVVAQPVNVSDTGDLRNVSDDLDGSYVLVEDIDLSDVSFEPIGDADRSFIGRFDGNGHVVTNLSVSEEGYAGLFGAVGENGTVENVGVENANVSGTGAGGLVGFNAGTVVRSYVTGNVTGDEPVGGLVGVHRGVVARSYSTADVTGNRTVGGLVGMAHAEPTGIVPGTRPDIEYAVVESYAAGYVDGDKRVGGVFGLVSLAPTDPRSVNDSVYWDVEATGHEDAVGAFGTRSNATPATGLTTSKMTGNSARESMSGFGFGDTWVVNDGYPELARRDQPSSVTIDRPERVPQDAEEDGNVSDDGDDEAEETPGFTFVVTLVAFAAVAWGWSYET